MKSKKVKQLKRILTGFGVGIAGTSSVIPVIACGGDEITTTTTGGAIEDAIEQVKKELALDNVELDNGIVSNLPDAPDDTHWEYRVGDDGNFSPAPPAQITPDQNLVIRLVSDSNAVQLPENVEAEVAVKDDLDDDSNFQVVEVTENTKTELDKIVVEEIQSAVTDVEELNKAFEKVRVDNFSNIINLPDAPDKTFWTFAVNDEANYQNVDKMSETNLVNGDKIKFKLAGKQDITLTDADLTEHVVTVTKTVFVGNLAEELANVPSKLSADMNILPTAVENTHWEYEFTDGTTTSLSDDLVTGEKITVKLVADENYYFNESVERDDFVFVHFIRTNDALQSTLDQVTIRANDEEIAGLPTAPNNSHWEYQIIKGSFTSNTYFDFSPVQYFESNILKPGDQIKIMLVPDNSNYQLAGEPVEKLVTVDKAIIDIESPMENGLSMKEQLQQDLDKFFNFNPANESINWVPDYIPEGTYWEYSIDDGEFTRESPRIGPEYYSGEKALNLKLRLTTNNHYDDSIYELNGSFEWSIQAAGIVDTTNYEEWIEAATPSGAAKSTSDGPDLPESPEHASILYNSEPWAVTDPNRPYHPYVYWIEPDEGWILSRDVVVGKDFI